jgi:hypothetical protein
VSPVLSYECVKKLGGCGMVFRDRRSVGTINKAVCPHCGASAEQVLRNGERIVQVQMPKVAHVHDVDHQDGRTGEEHYQPAFGKHVRTKYQISELQKRTREELYNRTEGPHTSYVPDPETGKPEPVTVTSKGLDVGPIRSGEPGETFEAPDLAKMAEKDVFAQIRKQREGK